jgi:type II restriction/modification system DNA methylase subunit YeeA
MFTKMLKASIKAPERFQGNASKLFAAMHKGGDLDFTPINWFNGGLYDDDSAFPLERPDIDNLISAAELDWSEIDPSILGTLFERGLDPSKRSQLGAHYTDRDKIMQIVEPVIIKPLQTEWEGVRSKLEAALAKAENTKGGARTKAENEAKRLQAEWHERLRTFRVLDPACGSGNFLYLSLLALKDIEHRTNLEAEAMAPLLAAQFPNSGPENVLGIELNPYAAELARVSIWVGEIQWMRRNGFEASKNPILKPLGNIENRDAVLDIDEQGQPQRAIWPSANVVVGNPPFLGNKKMIAELGEDYTVALRKVWPQVPGGADLVCYWFAGTWEQMIRGQLERAGLVATNSIRGGANRDVLKAIVEDGRIFEAWSDQPWFDEKGAAVRVSMVGFDRLKGLAKLDGQSVIKIHADLKSGDTNLAILNKLPQNKDCSFVGIILNGDGFELTGGDARGFLSKAGNPHGAPNSDVLRPTLNGDDFNGERPDKWVIDFGTSASEKAAALYEAPFEHIEKNVKPYRQRKDEAGNFEVRAKNEREKWWRHARARPALRKALGGLSHYLATPMVTSYRNFGFLPSAILPDQKLVVFSRDDFTFFGVLESNFHYVWTLATCSWIGSGNDVTYAKLAVFETFPFPEGLTPDIPAADYAYAPLAQKIAAAAARLNELRENWLNPADLVDRVPEVVEGYPDRILPKDEVAAEELKKRTLTNLYNARPTWLDHAHKALDEAVAEAYGWGDDFRNGVLTDDEILARLFKLNQERSAE